MYVCRSPQKGAPPPRNEEKRKSTVHGAPRGRMAYTQCGAAWLPKGIVYVTAVSTPVPCILRHDAFHLVLGRPESR